MLLLFKTISKVRFQITGLWISMKKGECFDYNHSLGSFPFLFIKIRLLHHVYYFSLLICYTESFLFHALMLVTLLEQNVLLMTIGKTTNLPTHFVISLTFWLASGLDFVLSVGVTTPWLNWYFLGTCSWYAEENKVWESGWSSFKFKTI